MKTQLDPARRFIASPIGILLLVLVVATVILWETGATKTIAAIITLVVTAVIALLQLKQAQDAQIAQARPVIRAWFEHVDDPMDRSGRFDLVVGHLSGGPAENVRFRFTPNLVNEDGKDIGAEPPFSTGIPLMASGDPVRVRFGSYDGYRTHWFFGPRPDGTRTTTGTWEATVTFNDPQAGGIEVSATFPIGVEHFFPFNLTSYERVMAEQIAQMPERHRRFYEGLMREESGGSEAAD